ncbi:MAG: succinyl-diaminopimelate desuccinylase [Succinivibrio sp.]
MTNKLSNTTALAVELIKKASITPKDEGCQDLVREALTEVGFNCLTLKDSGTENLLAVHGTGSPFLLFLGHTDVVPPGDEAKWDYPPFDAVITKDNGKNVLHGRGSQDMKGSDAAMTIALRDFVKDNPNHKGTVGLLLTSNEEGDAKGGTPFVVDYLRKHNLVPDYCLVGEPSCSLQFGDTIKNGRRGSVTAHISVQGVQGHVAYPDRCDNAAHKAGALIALLSEEIWDNGSNFFPPSSFQVTNIKCGTGAENVVPGQCYIMCNWRFNDALSPDSIKERVDRMIDSLKIKAEIRYVVNGLPFITKGGLLLDSLKEAVNEVTGIVPKLSTAGGTSDGRFIAPLGTKVVEFGPCSDLIHKVNEAVDLTSLDLLHEIYQKTLEKVIK